MIEDELKEKTAAVFAQVRAELDAFANDLTPSEKARRGSLQQWSAKDTLVHLAFWEKHYIQVFEKGLAGKPVPSSGNYLDQINDGVLYEHLEQPFEEARAEETAAYHNFLHFYEQIPAQTLADPQELAYLKNSTLLNRLLRSYAFHPVHHLSDYYVKNGQAGRANDLQKKLSEALSQLPLWRAEAFYRLASFYALTGWQEEAVAQLQTALAEKPELLETARGEDAFDSLRGMAVYLELAGK